MNGRVELQAARSSCAQPSVDGVVAVKTQDQIVPDMAGTCS